ncbi:MAG: general secretion pathway protein GspC, partial [Nitrospirae bacterium]|nr:general secretion pathway protein GspC [Nitrospirota bacterium]
TNQSAPKSDMSGLTLVGTVSGPRKYSYAIFMDKSNNQEVYRIGDAVLGYGVLQRIEKDKVYIKGGGAPVEIPVADFLSIVDAKPSPGNKPATFAENVGDGSYVVDQRKVQQAIEKPNQIMTDARLLPRIVDGKQQGFMLSEVKPGGIYQSLGLQNGDVLLRINEFSISNPERALQAFTALRGMDRAQLDIMRNGAKVTMTYQIK